MTEGGGIYQMGSDVLSGLGSAFNYQNPNNASKQWLDQIPDYLKQSYQPWMNQGLDQFNQSGDQYSQLMNDPGSKLNQFGQGYKQSPGYQFQVNQAIGAANRAAAAGGMAGSPEEQQQVSGVVNNLASQDYWNYMNHVLGLYGQGLQGSNYQAGLGENAANEYGTDMSQYLMTQANNAFSGAQNSNQRTAANWGQGIIPGLFGST